MRWRWVVLTSVLLGASGFMSQPAWAGLPSCPTGGATVDFTVDNETGAQVSVTLKGTQVSASCSSSGLLTSYTITVTCGVGVTTCGGASQSSLESGIWNNTIAVGAQQQAKEDVFIAGSSANALSWTAFATVLTVNNTGDGTGTCPSSSGLCTLRAAISTANSCPAPVLVQFDPTVFPAGTQTKITLSSTSSITITGNKMTIDGTDLNGNPGFVGDPYGTAPVFNRLVQLPSSGATFVFRSQQATLSGLFLQRPTQSTGATPGDVVLFDGSTNSGLENTIANVKIDGGGGSVTDKSSGNDCIGSENNAGTSFANANVVTNSELEFCLDKAVKAAYNSYVIIQNSWAHQNIGGGLQATLSGHLEAYHNVVEQSGSNSSSVVYTGANGLSSNGNNGTGTPNSDLDTQGNVTRDNALRGLTANGSASNASLQSDFSCGNVNGVSLVSGASNVTARGSAFVGNTSNGAVVDSTSSGDFGTSSDAGNNAFRGNSSYDFEYLGTSSVNAINDQWGTSPPNIYAPKGGTVSYAPVQSAKDAPIAFKGFSVSKAPINGIVHIQGSGFNAVDPSGSCPAGNTLSNFNHCDSNNNPVAGSGNCVTVAIPNSTLIAQPKVIGVTPTDIAILLPSVTCSEPTTVKVSKVKSDGVTVLSASGTFCTN